MPKKIKPIDKGGQRKHTENVHEKPRSPLRPQTAQRSVIKQKKCNDCTVCGKNFESSRDLKQHILFVHEKIKPSLDISKIETFDEEMDEKDYDELDFKEEELEEDEHVH